MQYKPSGICPHSINFDMVDGKLHNVCFEGGCPGNLVGISALVEGMDAQDVVQKFEGVDCRGKGTSCPDQLAKAVKEQLHL
jgi:uncharacterized protein (TIGR03905 family)